MRIGISTPALLFPAISLLLLACTNRFLGLASVIRNLHRTHTESPNPVMLVSLGLSFREIRISGRSLDLHLQDLKKEGVA